MLVAVALVEGEGDEVTGHAVVWDGWRRVLFVGPGAYDDRGLDGALLLSESDCMDPSHVDPEHGMAVSAYVASKFGIRRFSRVYAIMVHANRLHETSHV